MILVKRIHEYRPQRTSPEHLEVISVAREGLLQKILTQYNKWQPGASRQHYLLIGPRGIGKTHVLCLIAHRIQIQPKLDKKLTPIIFAEEFYGITRVSDLLVDALRILSEETGDNDITQVYQNVRYDDDNDRVTDLSLDSLRRFHKSSGKGILFMIENINRILERQIKDKSQIHLLRKILIEEDWLIAICTSPTYLNAVTREEEPLFEFFQVEFLSELSTKEQFEMLEKLTVHDNNIEFRKYLKKYRSRLRALYHFTGGNPRLTIMLYDLISYQAITNVQTELDGLLDKITPFYQDRMKDIGEQGGKLIETMALMPEGCTPTDLARGSRMESKTVRAVLQRLGQAGYIRSEQRRQKKTVYIIPERLFRIWHQMNHSRSGRGLVRYLLEFFSTWYASREERDEVWNEITKQIQDRIIFDDEDIQREDLSEYLEYVIAVSEGSEQYEREFDRLRKLVLSKGMNIVEQEIERIDAKYDTDGDYFIHKGFFLSKDLRDHHAAYDAFKKASELKPDDIIPLFNQAVSLENLGDRTEANLIYTKTEELLTQRIRSQSDIDTQNALIIALRDETSYYCVKISAYLLRNFDSPEIIRRITEILQNANEDWRRQNCATALGRPGSAIAVPVLLNYLCDESHKVRGSAATALGVIGSEKAVDHLINALDDEANDVRGSAANALGKIGSEKAVDQLVDTLNDDNIHVQNSVIIALVRILAEINVSNFEKVIRRIIEHLNKISEKVEPIIIRNIFKIVFATSNMKMIRYVVESIKAWPEFDDTFYNPYTIALEYLDSDRDPAIIERQHPEMRDAIQLLVELFNEKKLKK